MSSGKQHNKYNTVSLILLAALVLLLLKVDFFVLVLFVIGAVIGTFLLGPDLDIKSQLYFRWGMYSIIWDMYQKVFNHRSLFSHLPIISDLIRVLFLYIFFFIAWGVIELEVLFEFSFGYILIGILVMVTLYRMNSIKLDVVVAELLVTFTIAAMYNYLKVGKEVYFVLYEWELFIVFFGLVYSTTVHTFSDVMYSSVKKMQKKKRKKKRITLEKSRTNN